MKIAKTLRITGIVILTLILVLVIAFHLFGTKAIKIGIEVGATQALKVPVAVEDVSLSILAGKAGVKNLIIDNPSGYKNEKMLELGQARIDLDMGSVLSETIRIEDILLEKVSVVLEQKGLTNNIQEVLNGMSSESPESKAEEEQPSEKPSKKLLIKKLQINEVAVKVKLLPLPGKTDTIVLKLAPITMTDLGSDNKMDVAVLTNKILLAIVSGISKQGAGILPDEIIKPLGDSLKILGAATEAVLKETGKVLEEGGKALKEVGETGKQTLDETKKLGEDLKKGLGDLFKPKDKDKDKK
ncbi:MAG: AsmA family protein [Sedimentisphaerales bacterium]|nr:AsmA family protein [Sedimentisphaerales bacterium]